MANIQVDVTKLNSAGTPFSNYAVRHNEAVQRTISRSVDQIGQFHQNQKFMLADSIVTMLTAWARYGDAHRRMFDSPIGEDYVLGPAWQRQGEAIRELLNGETGALDCGTLDAFILDTMRENGFTHLSNGVDEL